MKKLFQSIGYCLMITCLLISAALVYGENQNVSFDDTVYQINTLPFINTTAPEPSSDDVTLNDSRWNKFNAIDGSVVFSHLYGAIFSAQYTRRLGNYNAVSLLGDGGEKQYRINATWGIKFPENQLAKITIDYLAQHMNFSFATEDEKAWIGQTAYGAEYKFLRPKKFLNDIFFKGYYSQTQSKNIDSVTYFQNGEEWRNDRRIAGGTAASGSAGIHILPARYTLIGASINYSGVTYDTAYNSSNSDSRGIGGSITLDQLIGSSLSLHVLASEIVPLQHYVAEIVYTPTTRLGNQLDISVGISRDISEDGLFNDSQSLARLRYWWGISPDIAARYVVHQPVVLGASGRPADLMAWTHTPAVKMSQVLAIADQRLVQVSDIVMVIPSNQGNWIIQPEAVENRITTSTAGTLTISTVRGTLHADDLIAQLEATSDGNGHTLGDYVVFHVVAQQSQTIKFSATWLDNAQNFWGSASFPVHIVEDDATHDSGNATITLIRNASIPIATNTLKSLHAKPNDPVTVPFDAGTFINVDAQTTYKICEIGATRSDDCQTTVDGLMVTGKNDGSVTVTGNAPANNVTTVHSIIAVNEFGASQPSPDNGVRVKIMVDHEPPTVKDYQKTIALNLGQSFSEKAIPVGIFSNVDGATQYQVCRVDPNTQAIYPCQDTYSDKWATVYATANDDGSVQIHGNEPQSVYYFLTFSIIAITPYGSTTPSAIHGARVNVDW